MKTIEITTGMNGMDAWETIYRERVTLRLGESATAAIKAAHKTVKDLMAKGGPAYGINTGFGRLSDTVIDEKDIGTAAEKRRADERDWLGGSLDSSGDPSCPGNEDCIAGAGQLGCPSGVGAIDG